MEVPTAAGDTNGAAPPAAPFTYSTAEVGLGTHCLAPFSGALKASSSLILLIAQHGAYHGGECM